MKKHLLIFTLLAFSAIHAIGQNAAKYSNYPHWTISKDIQRMQYRDVTFTPLAPASGDLSIVVAKNVNRINRRQTFLSTPVRLGGTPAHVISKGVARRQVANRK